MKAVIIRREGYSGLALLSNDNVLINDLDGASLKSKADFEKFYYRGGKKFTYQKTKHPRHDATKEQILCEMKEKNPKLQTLIEKFDLV